MMLPGFSIVKPALGSRQWVNICQLNPLCSLGPQKSNCRVPAPLCARVVTLSLSLLLCKMGLMLCCLHFDILNPVLSKGPCVSIWGWAPQITELVFLNGTHVTYFRGWWQELKEVTCLKRVINGFLAIRSPQRLCVTNE